MSSVWNGALQISIFGQSHSPAIGVTIDGLPAGEQVDWDALCAFLARRAPGQNAWSTPRQEADRPELLSGLVNGFTCGAPLTALIRNTNTKSGDYDTLRDVPRPGHADLTGFLKYRGFADGSGGGHFSGRLTAPLCIAGGICLQLLARRGIRIGAHIAAIDGVQDRRFDPVTTSVSDLDALLIRHFPVLDETTGGVMQAHIAAARAEQDSVGGVIECIALDLPAGLGDPMFDGMENRIARAAFAIPAVKGIEFGAGFAAAAFRGSENNDPFYIEDTEIKTRSNHHGGILGGITSGMPLLFRVAVKPTPSIAQPQESVRLSTRESTTLSIHGRHDPCIVPRAVPCVEAAAAIALLDAALEAGLFSHP